MLSIAGIQLDIQWHDREANYHKVHDMAYQAKQKGADVIVLPETFATGFSLDTQYTKEPINGPTPQFLRLLAQELKISVIGGFILQQEHELPHNVCLSVDSSGKDLALYSKMHLIGIMGEPKVHAPGSKPSLFTIGSVHCSSFICYDLRFPTIFQHVADSCDCMIIIASWPSIRQQHWNMLLQARAIENQCYVVGVNRIGSGGNYSFSGGSTIINPLGEVLCTALNEESVIVTTIDAHIVKDIRTKLPFLKDRKTS